MSSRRNPQAALDDLAELRRQEPWAPLVWLGSLVSESQIAPPANVTIPDPEATRGLGAAIADRLAARDIEPGRGLRRQAQRAAATQLLVQTDLERLSSALDRIPWMLFKGCDLASRAFARPDHRPVADIDILIREHDLEQARSALEAAGWSALYDGPRSERYLKSEGYCWQAVRPGGSVLEVHYRLWGSVPEELAVRILERSESAPEHGDSASRPRVEDAYLIAAVHAWLQPRPRDLVDYWDLERLAITSTTEGDTAGLTTTVASEARTMDLQLPVTLSAACAAVCFGHPLHLQLVSELTGDLEAPERYLLGRLLERGPDHLSMSAYAAARLLAGRRTRAGMRSLWRALWPHSGVVERQTPEGWPWPKRRVRHQLRRWFGSSRPDSHKNSQTEGRRPFGQHSTP